MNLLNQSPIVTFTRDGKTLQLGTGLDSEDVLHLHGSTGLGLAPADISLKDRINADGAHIDGVRYGAREVFIPLFIQKPTRAECTEVRRSLYRLLAPYLGQVEITIFDQATGTRRSIKGLLKDGLEGDFGQDFHGSWQTLGLTFICPDPWWRGEPHLISNKVSPGVKTFISETVPFFPVILAQSTVQGAFEIEVQGDGPIEPTWQVTGPGTDLVISNGTDTFTINHTLRVGETVTIDAAGRRITPDLWDKVPLSSRLFNLTPGTNRLNITMVGATTETTVDLVYSEKYMEAI